MTDLQHLLDRFTAASLPAEEWTHRAHLAVGLAWLRRYPEDEALERMRAGIQRLNASHGVVTTLESGYHETLTVFWMRELARFLRDHGHLPDAELCERAWSRFDRDYVLRFYSRQALRSPEARSGWVEPDLPEASTSRSSRGSRPPSSRKRP